MEGRTNKIKIKDVKGTYLAKLSLHECLFESVYDDFWRSYCGSMCVSDRGVIHINKITGSWNAFAVSNHSDHQLLTTDCSRTDIYC